MAIASLIHSIGFGTGKRDGLDLASFLQVAEIEIEIEIEDMGHTLGIT